MTLDGLTGQRRLGFFARAFALISVCILASTGSAFAAGGCGVTARAGLQDLTFMSGGVERTAVAFVPQGYTGKAKVPVVFDLHGSNSFPRDQMIRSKWPDVARENGFIVVAPQGGLSGKVEGTHAWNVPGVVSSVAPPEGNGPDDVAFLSDTLAQVKAKFCVDPDRIYASGYSGGGRMLSQYICSGNTEFTAAGFIMSLRAGVPVEDKGRWLPDPASCHPGRPVSIIAFWGLKDTTNPYVGGGKAYWQYSGEVALNRWAALDGCDGNRKIVKGVKVSSAEFDRCKGGARILSYTIADQTHDWPGQTVGFTLAKGKNVEDVYAAKRMWAFFDSGDGRLIADNVAKDVCADATKTGTAAATNPACSVTMKAKAKQPAAVDNPMAADAL
ncbi:alpha/beta hydrolase family esterase [Allorhizobium taibaishanense]|uniref:Polyhydroxybutyrate depolymerase n=1 Tax=Allorhizobium taibaishanense TaxID=887144 RepID=A0A1Q9A4F0_9HYPH|nr:alpha/beta hydrolase-fold protein [Allorhizobium taibaishanense]MBB4006531.1 polyhydroxybutyrate depolymerase [Allorhizobium taibaishanense]OLP49460.1 hypothetical protein BJF91_20720 [Allorhizobium taibaishanense]